MADQYACIAADPPWAERGGGKIKRGADRHYPLLSTPQIIQVMLSAPAWRPADNAHLWLWVTNNFLADGLHVMQALGFRYVTNMVWTKIKADGTVRIGLGQYLRGAHELCLFGVRGRLSAVTRKVPSAFLAPRAAHSAKPDEAYAAIQGVSPGPRLEMFARAPREGWDVWGNEVDDLRIAADNVAAAHMLTEDDDPELAF